MEDEILRLAAAQGERIETADEAIQLLGDSITGIFDQLIKGKWVDEHGHRVEENLAMHAAAATMERVMEFRTRVLGYSYTPEASDGK